MPRVAKYVQITATSKVYSCEVKVKERTAPAVLRRIRRAYQTLAIKEQEKIWDRGCWRTVYADKLSVNIVRL